MSAEPLLAVLLRQCIRPDDADACDACTAMQVHRQVIRELAPLLSGADQCPWHQGYELGWRAAAKAVEEVLQP